MGRTIDANIRRTIEENSVRKLGDYCTDAPVEVGRTRCTTSGGQMCVQSFDVGTCGWQTTGGSAKEALGGAVKKSLLED